MNIIFFENNKTQNLSPITLTRPAFDILCGGTTLHDLAKFVFKPSGISSIVQPHLKKIVQLKFPNSKKNSSSVLFLDSCIVPSVRILQHLFSEVSKGKPIIVKKGKTIIAAYLRSDMQKFTLDKVQKFSIDEVLDFFKKLKLPEKKVAISCFENLWDTIVQNKEIIKENLEVFKTSFQELKSGVCVGKKVIFEDEVFLDTKKGPIVIEDGCKIESKAILRGPLFIGKNSLIKSFAELKDGSSIGAMCKVGGEVEASIIQGYSNKQHFGFLGHAYIGEWVNMGAGTTNSDLKNTYGEIKMQGQKTGQQFLGCVIGDYSKTAVMTALYTAKVVGVNSSVYGVVCRDIPSFSNHLSQFQKMVEFPLEVAKKTQKIMFERRKIRQTQTHIQLLSDVFKITQATRKDANITPGKLGFHIV